MVILSVALTLGLPTITLADTTSTSTSGSGQVIRLSGPTRYDTAITIANELAKLHNINFSKGELFNAAVLASGNNYPDALAGAPLAAQVGGPILLLDSTPGASSETLNYVETHVNKNGNIYLLGGTGIIPQSFTDALVSLGFNKDSIHQIGGQNRDETSMLIAEQLKNPQQEAIVSSDSNFYDALTISPAAVYDNAPILLVSSSGLTADQKAFCDAQKSVLGLGEIVPSLSKTYPRLLGFSDANRYDTNGTAVTGIKNRPFVFLATGEDYPDALAGAVIAGEGACPIVLTTPTSLQPETEKALNIISYYDKQSITDTNSQGQTISVPAVGVPTLYVLGGTGAVSDDVVSQAEAILNGPGYSK